MDPAAVCHIYCMALTVQASSKPHQGHRGMASMAVSDSAALAVQAVTESSAFTASLQLTLHHSQSAPLSKQLQAEFQRWWMALALLQRSMPDSSSEIAGVQGRFGELGLYCSSITGCDVAVSLPRILTCTVCHYHSELHILNPSPGGSRVGQGILVHLR